MFVVPSATFRLLIVMLVLAHNRRNAVRFDVTQHPSAGWLSRQVTEAFPCDTAPRCLLRDRDASYGALFSKRVEAMRIATSSRRHAHRGKTPTSRGLSARSAESVWITSSSSTSAIYVGCFRPTSIITTVPERIYRSEKTARIPARSSHRHAGRRSPFRKSLVCTIATNASPPDSARCQDSFPDEAARTARTVHVRFNTLSA
jgi:hypothetical protein